MPQESEADLRRIFTVQPTVFLPPKELMDLHSCLQTIVDPASVAPSRLQPDMIRKAFADAEFTKVSMPMKYYSI